MPIKWDNASTPVVPTSTNPTKKSGIVWDDTPKPVQAVTPPQPGILEKISGGYKAYADETRRLAGDIFAGSAQMASSVASGLEWLGFNPGGVVEKTRVTLDEMAKVNAPVDPTFVDNLAMGVGSFGAFFVPGVGIARTTLALTKVSPAIAMLFGNSASTALEAMSEAGSVYQSNLDQSGDVELANKMATRTFWGNAVLIGITNRFGLFNENLKGALKKAIFSAPVEGFQEAVQQVISNLATDRPIDEGVKDSFLIGAILGAGGGALEQVFAKPPLKPSETDAGKRAKEIIDAGGTPNEATLELSQTLTPEQAKNIVNSVVRDNLTPEDVNLTQNAPITTPTAETVVPSVETTPEAGKQAKTTLQDVFAKVDNTILNQTPANLQESFNKLDEEVNKRAEKAKAEMKLADENLKKAKPNTQEKKDAKLNLEKAKTKIREANGYVQKTMEAHAEAFRKFFSSHVKTLNKDLTDAQVNEIVSKLSDKITNVATYESVKNDNMAKVVKTLVDEINPPAKTTTKKAKVSTKVVEKKGKEPEFKVGDVLDPQGKTNMVGKVTISKIEGNTIKFTDENGTEFSGMQKSLVKTLVKEGSWKKGEAKKEAPEEKEIVRQVVKNGEYPKTPREFAKKYMRGYVLRGNTLAYLSEGYGGETGGGYSVGIGGYVNGKSIGNKKIAVTQFAGKDVAEIFSLKELYDEILKEKTTQKEEVKKVIEKKGKASIKEIAKETGIVEPNIRRILGVGAKDGTFERIAEGVYTITKDGEKMAYIIPGDALEVMPKLVAEGFKSDMVFLDIPYKTQAVTGGNRGVKYDLISVEQFGKVLDNVSEILRTEKSPIIHMFSQATSGLKEMQKYNDLFAEKGFVAVGRGGLTKLQQDGITEVRNMRGDVMKPEGILVLTKSGELNKELKNLNFKLVRPKGYATEKPAQMISDLIKMTTEEGDVVFDPFAGSGVVPHEAVKAGRKAVAIEKKTEQAKKIAERVQGNDILENLKDTFGNDTEQTLKELREKDYVLELKKTSSINDDMWAEHISEPSRKKIDKIKEEILAGKEMPPILLNTVGGMYDGHHRLQAFKELGVKEIKTLTELKKTKGVVPTGKIIDKLLTKIEKTFYRGGGMGSMPKTGTAQDVLDYERVELGNTDVVAEKGVDLSKIPAKNLVWLTETKESAKDYGKVEEVILNEGEYQIVARDSDGGVLIDKLLIKEDNKTNGKDTTNSPTGGNNVDENGVPEPLPVGGKEPGGAGVADTGNGKGVREQKPAKRSNDIGKRLGTRLTNEEIDAEVSKIAEIGTNGEVSITGEITDEILEIANQYRPGGETKSGRGILDEYYTASEVVDLTKSLLDFPVENMKVLEPSVGSGNFLYALPETGTHDIRSYEINPITAKIAKIFHNDARVFNTSFETNFVDERGNKKSFDTDYDLVIGNPPYGEHRGQYLGLGEEKGIKKYEDYFVKRGLDVLKEGGTLAFVLPSSFMDRATVKNAVLKNAFRLPEGAFSGTSIGTDIVILTKKTGAETNLTKHFEENPSTVLGEEKTRKNRFGKTETFVSGTLEDAITNFYLAKDTLEAVKILTDNKIPVTEESIAEQEKSVEEAGEKGAEKLAKEETHAKKVGKKTIEKKITKVSTTKGKTVSLSEQFVNLTEEETTDWLATGSDGALKDGSDTSRANFYDGKYYIDFNYLQGDIYEKLDQLEKDKATIGDNQYNTQKAKLLSLIPSKESIGDIKLSPNIGFVKNLKTNGEDTLQSDFLKWLGTVPRNSFGDSSTWEIRAYTKDESVTGSDKDLNERVRVRRKKMADSLFEKYLNSELTDYQKSLVAEEYNKTFNFYHSPDYSKVPIFADVFSEYKNGQPLTLNDAQRAGIGRLVNMGIGIIAHEVGFGKTLTGILATYETMQRGWAQKPLIVCPSDNVYNQWKNDIETLIPNAKLNLLGNLGASFKGDLSSLKIEPGTFTLVTYEGLKKLSFKNETYKKMSEKFSYVSDDLTKHKTARDAEKAKAKGEETSGTMKKGTRADLFFEDLGFDLMTFDEIHNANHIVSKVKLAKGQASEYSRFGLRASDLGMKTWLASQYIQDKTNGRNVYLLSATPFTNHPLEYYSIFSLVADKSLKKMGLLNVNDFFGTFMDAEHDYEFKADGTYQKKTDIRKFKNYRQFSKLRDTYIDIKQDSPEIVRPTRVQKTYEIPQNDLTKELNAKAQEIFKENEKEAGKGAKTLRAITELRKISFSPYVSKFGSELPTPSNKMFVENSPKLATVMGIIKQNKADKPEAGQIIYSEVGVESFPILKEYLVKEIGYKANEVEIISGGTPKPRRLDIQEKYNAGDVKIIIGSEAISEGMNLQRNTTDMHLLSLPWNFTALRQVIGRGWRQGNMWANVRINQYFIRNSVDVFLSQKLDNKQKRYEQSIASNANEVDVGDVSYNDMKFDLVQDPKERAKLEISAEKDRVENEIKQAKAELSFATRKLDKIQEMDDKLKTEKAQLVAELAGDKNEYWLERHEQNIKKYTDERIIELENLSKKGINVKTLLETKEKGELEITKLEEKLKTIETSFDERVKTLTEQMPPEENFSHDMIAQFMADRAEENKTFYTKKIEEKKETIAVAPRTKEEKKVGKKVAVTKKTAPRVERTGTQDKRVLDILAKSDITVEQKVNEILNEKQTGKEFKDTGVRVAGSKKERATINTVLENADIATIAEMVKSLGADTIAETLHKDEILEKAIKPDVEADKKAGVPAYITGWKIKVLNSIGRTPTIVTKRTKYNSRQEVPTDSLVPFLTNYPKYLQMFTKDLADIKNMEGVNAFEAKYRWNFVNNESQSMLVNIGVLGKAIKKVIQDGTNIGRAIANVQDQLGIIANPGRKSEYSERYYGLDYSSTGYYATKEEAIAKTEEYKEDRIKDLNDTLDLYNNNYDHWLPKKKAIEQKSDDSHANFKPLDKVERSEPDIADEKINPETLMKENGFRSVQLGNYMDDATAKEHLRYTIGAVQDMSKLLGVDFPKLINKKGLSIAFGARGGGRFNAHYEPSHNIINLTKGRGDGSFFHEFIHFLDEKSNSAGYRGTLSSKKDRWYRSNPLDMDSAELMSALTGKRINKVKEFTPREDPYILDRPEDPVMVMRANGKTFEEAIAWAKGATYPGSKFQDIADVYRKNVKEEAKVYNEKTAFYDGAVLLGGGSQESYWSRPHELLARAGQAYIEDKMIEAGMKNNYLTRTTLSEGETSYDKFIKNAYPQGDERKIFKNLFDKVFEDIAKDYPFKDYNIGDARFKFVDKVLDVIAPYQTEKATVGVNDAMWYLNDARKRLGIDFDTYLVSSILGTKTDMTTKMSKEIEAWGVTYDNSIALVRQMATYTAPHELGHLVLANIEKIGVFKRAGLTREKLLKAQAEKMGIVWNKQTDKEIEEQIMLNFEKYLDNKYNQGGIIKKYFNLLKIQLVKFAKAIIGTKGDIVKDFYDLLDEGRTNDEEMERIENSGIIEAFMSENDTDVLEGDKVEEFASMKFKEKPKDARLQKISIKYNDLVKKQVEIEQGIETWKKDLEINIAKAEQTAEVVNEAPENVKDLSRFTNRKAPPVGQLTDRGEAMVEELGFANKELAQAEIHDYLQTKNELVTTRAKLRELRRAISEARTTKKADKTVLRDLERRLKLRKRYLEQKDIAVKIGVNKGKKQQMRMIWKRGRVLSAMQDAFTLGDKKAKEIIGGRKIHLMSEWEFNNFLSEFASKAEIISNTLSAQDELKSYIAEMEFKKEDNLRKALGLPTNEKMNESQAKQYLDALSKYQFGDTFLTKRELETVHRTDWGKMETERELLAKMKTHIGVGKEEMMTLEAPQDKGKYTSWIRLARQHPFYNWLIQKRIIAKIQAEREFFAIEKEVNKLATSARNSRTRGVGDVLVPTDDIVFGYLEAEDKEAYATKEKMTQAEKDFASYLITQYFNAYEYLNSEYGMKGRKNYMVHTRRDFWEALKEGGVMSALRETMTAQKEEEAGFKILDEQTGDVLAFEKFFGNMMHRTGGIVPSKNVAKASLQYFKALATKRAMDSFIPEALLAVQAHKALKGTTPKGLSLDPTVEGFVKRFLNDAKGRKIDFVTEQGSKKDIALRTAISLTSLKYLGGNVASAIGNMFGDFVAIGWELNAKEVTAGLVRSIQLKRASELNKQFAYFTGRNPLSEVFDTENNFPAQIKQGLMVLMGMASFQSSKFFLRSKLTNAEFMSGIVSDERLAEIASSLNRVKPNKFYIKSLAGNTTMGSAFSQFGSWAIAMSNAVASDGMEVIKMAGKGEYKKAFTSREAQKLAKFTVLAGLFLWIASLVDVDDDDYSLGGRTMRSIKNNLSTLFQSLQFVTDPTNYFMIVQEVINVSNLFTQILTQEEYKKDGIGYAKGDPKWINSGERIITPSVLKQFFPKTKEDSETNVVSEAISSGNFNAPNIVDELYKTEIADRADDVKNQKEYRDRKIGEITRLYYAEKNYKDDPVLDIVINTQSTDDTVDKMIQLGKTLGEKEVYLKLRKLYGDRKLCSNSTKKTGCFVSGNLIKAYQIARRKQKI